MNEDKKNLLISMFVAALVISNVLSAKLIQLGPLTVPGGVVCYAVTYLMTDILGELYGKETAGRTVIYGLLCQIVCTALISLTLLLPAADKEIGEAYQVALGMNGWFTAAGLLSYIVSQLLDVEIFHGIRRKLIKKGPKHRWVWNNVSTILSQAVDTVVFLGIAFGFGMGYLFDASLRGVLWRMMGSQYLVKVILAIADTPIFYLLTRNREKIIKDGEKN